MGLKTELKALVDELDRVHKGGHSMVRRGRHS
ncbi:Uncharacterised protein [Pseudomonas aeruginosa]|nr:Uncharacterised protein [Pseudomonas aeruginosa]